MPANNDKSIYMLRNGLLYKSCPSCSEVNGQNVFYKCPKYYGYNKDDENREYIQSLCIKCSDHVPSLSILFDGGTLLKKDDIIVPEIRVLPLSTEIFNTYDKVIEFLKEEMPSRGNTYYYISHKMVAKKNALVMFQYDGNIIAYALCEGEKIINEDNPYYAEGYRGYYVFVKDSIRILSSPINNNIMRKKFSINLSQATHRIKLEYFPILVALFEES